MACAVAGSSLWRRSVWTRTGRHNADGQSSCADLVPRAVSERTFATRAGVLQLTRLEEVADSRLTIRALHFLSRLIRHEGSAGSPHCNGTVYPNSLALVTHHRGIGQSRCGCLTACHDNHRQQSKHQAQKSSFHSIEELGLVEGVIGSPPRSRSSSCVRTCRATTCTCCIRACIPGWCSCRHPGPSESPSLCSLRTRD
jgi:hypothetical protein